MKESKYESKVFKDTRANKQQVYEEHKSVSVERMTDRTEKKIFRRVTRADVAHYAQVSETIVSYVINNNRYVDKKKRERVLKAVNELHYRPNNSARALKGKNTNSILFIADRISNEHFSKLIVEMDNYAYNYGYLISLCANRNTVEFVSQIISRQYDGIVVSSISFPDEFIRQLTEAHIPVVLLLTRDYGEFDGRLCKIGTGLHSGAKECVRYLAERGRKKILYIDRYSSRGEFSTMADLRFRGFAEQMSVCGFELTEANIITGCKTEEETFAAVQLRIRDGFVPDAIFGRNDHLASIAMSAVRELGYLVPRDIAVIGFDNSSISKVTVPKLTTIEIKRGEIGRAAVGMLYQMIGGQIPEPLYFKTELIEREST